MTDAPATALPDEDRFDLRNWRVATGEWVDRDIVPRPGLPTERPFKPVAGMTEHWRRVGFEGRMPYFRAAAASPKSDPAMAAALEAYLDGEPDPLGAAAAFEIAFAIGTSLWSMPDYVQFDAWLGEHGPEFAVRAVLEQCTIRVVGERTGTPFNSYMTDHETPVLEPHPVEPIGAQWGRGLESHRVREMLAALPEPEYRRYRAVFENLSRNHRQRVTRAFCMPTERDWVDQACAEWSEWTFEDRGAEHKLLASVTSTDQLAAAGLTVLNRWNRSMFTLGSLIEGLGVDAAPIMVETAIRDRAPEWDRVLKAVLATLPHDAAVEYLLTGMVADRTASLAHAAAERFPRRTLRAIARLAEDASPSLRSRFAYLVTSLPVLRESAYAAAEPPVREAIDRLLNLDGSPPEAEPGDLPEFLADPPWKTKRPKRKRLTAAVAPLEEVVLRWVDGERERWADWGKGVEETQHQLAESGVEAVPKVLAALAGYPRLHRSLPPVGGVEAARLAADWLLRLRSTRLGVMTWLARHGVDAATWLVPDAVGGAGKPRKAAETMLRQVAHSHGDAAVLDAAQQYGEAAVAAVAEILAADPLDLDGRKAPRVPDWVEPILGTPVLLRGRERRLPRAATEQLVGAMMLDSLSIPYAGLDIAKEHCDAASLRELSWAVFESWSLAGAPTKDAWAFTQLARFADDETVERLETLIGRWPGEGFTKRAVNGLEVLGAIGSEAALRVVFAVQKSANSKPLKEAAGEQAALIALGMGLDAEGLADRLVPDFELGEEGTLDLDYGSQNDGSQGSGPRQFKVGFDERLRPFVIDGRGKVRRSLPKPAEGDDPEAAAEAGKRFALLKKGLKSVATEQVKRLELAMVDGRTWSVPEFQRHLVDHALMWHLTKRLVWQCTSATGTTAFRLAEDRTWTDADENVIAPPEDARIRISHPALLENELPAWIELFADYEVIQPFEQLMHSVSILSEAEKAAGRLTRFEGEESTTGALFGLTRRDWHPLRHPGTGWTSGLVRRLRGGGAVRVELEPGFGGGYYFDAEEVQTVKEVRLPDHPMDPVTLSAVIQTLARATKTEIPN